MLRPESQTPQQFRMSDASVDRMLEELTQRSDTEVDAGAFFAFIGSRISEWSISFVAVWQVCARGQLNMLWRSTKAQQCHCENDRVGMPFCDGVDVATSPLTSSQCVGDPDFVRVVIETDLPRLVVSPHEGRWKIDSAQQDFNQTVKDEFAVVVPWRSIGDQHGAIVCWGSPNVALDTRFYLTIMAAISEIVARFQSRQRLLALERSAAENRQLDSFLSVLYSCSGVTQLANQVVNDGRMLVASDRMSLVLRSGKRWKVTAISGATHVHRHSPSARSLGALCRTVAVAGQPIWHGATSEDLPPQISDAIADYLDHSPASSLAVIPLRTPSGEDGQDEPAIGALVIEHYRQDNPGTDAGKEMILAIAKHSAIAIAQATRVERVPGIRLGLWLADHPLRDWISARMLAGLAAMMIAVGALFIVPADIRVRAPGQWMPEVRREVFAPRDAVITGVLVQHGQWVELGQPLLELRSTDLQLELQQVDSELHQARKRLAVTQSERLQLPPGDAEARNRQRRLTADEEQYQLQVANLEVRQQILQQHQKQLTVLAPIAGQVLTWNANERLETRPVQRGQALLSVADTNGNWQAELQVPGRHAGRLAEAYNAIDGKSSPVSNEVMIASSTAPGTWIRGRLETLSSRLSVDSDGTIHLPAIAGFENQQETKQVPLVPGASVVARINCGRGTLAQSLFFELVDAVRLWLPF